MIERIDKYTIERELGQGGFGKVYLAFDPDAGRRVAIKKIRVEGDPDLLRRFQLEIRVTASLHHKNIVTIHDSGEEEGDPYLVMEYLEGYTLKHVIEQRLPLTLLEKVRIMTQVAEGFAYAHSKGVVHRDVKPENIMLMPDDNVKIMDFGIALGPNRHTNVTQTGGIIGTPPYFAPEQLEGYKANEQTDIFSFGDVYYELLAGVHPFEQYKGDWRTLQIAIMSYEPRLVSELTPGCPEALETLVHRTLAKEPEFRYHSFDEIQLDSEAILVDLKHEGAAAIVREVMQLLEAGDLQTALVKILHAFKMEPGNREIRRLREEINLRLQKEQVRGRIAELSAEADKQIGERRYAEAVRNLELAARLDSTNLTVVARLGDARQRLEAFAKSNRLVSEARFHQQKGHFAEAQGRLEEALAIDPEHTEARRLSQRGLEQMERQREEQRRQQAIRGARAFLAGRHFAEAKAALDEIERELPGSADVADLRAEVVREEALEERRQRAEKFNLALADTRAALQIGNLERAKLLLDNLYADFAADPGAPEALADLRDRLEGLVQAREIGLCQQKARKLIQQKEFRPALDVLGEALRKYPDDTGLERLRKAAEDLDRAQRRSEDIAQVLAEANARRGAGDLQGALDVVLKGRRDLGDEIAFVDLEHELKMYIEQQRYNAALESLLKNGRELMAAGRYSAVIQLLEGAVEFGGEAEVQTLLDSARVAAAIEEEGRAVAEALAGAKKLEGEAAYSQALSVVEKCLAIYPHNLSLTQTADRLRDRVVQERRRHEIERYRKIVIAEIEGGRWAPAAAALRTARAEFPGDSSFDDLAERIEAGTYEEGWRRVAASVQQDLAANSIADARWKLDDQATRTLYAKDPRWQMLADEVAKRQGYEDALTEADRKRKEGHLSEAEELLTEVIRQGPPDKRAHQMRGSIQSQKSEALRQQEIARIAEGIKENLRRDELERAGTELAAGRARYPGEEVWTELQSQLDARQQALRRQADIAAAADKIRQALNRDELRQARTVLNAACAKYPGEGVWTGLEEEIDAREAVLTRQHQIASIAKSIRHWLNRDHVQDVRRGSSPVETRATLLRLRREDLGQATVEVQGARAKFAGEDLWDALQVEIDDRHAFLNGEEQAAGGVSQALERGQVEQAEAQLTQARAKYPDDEFWKTCQTEITHQREQLERQADVARLAQGIRARLQRDDLRGARTELAAAQAKYPQQADWAVLQAQIEAREAAVARQAEIAATVESLRAGLDAEIAQAMVRGAGPSAGTYPIAPVWDVLAAASERLKNARGKYPEEAIWDTLQSEFAQRQAAILSEITETVRACPTLTGVDWNAKQVASARARHPQERFWPALQAEIDARRQTLEQASMAECEALVRASVQQGDPRAARSRLGEARTKHPGAQAWAALQAEIEACEREIARRQELDEVERQVLALMDRAAQIAKEADHRNPIELQWEAFQQAGAALSGARARYPAEERLLILETELGVKQGQWQRGVVQEIGEATRTRPSQEVLDRYVPQISALRTRDPKEPLWGRLKAEFDKLEALLKRQRDVAAAGERIRELLRAGDVGRAASELKAGRAKYSDEALWATLQAEISARRSEIDEACKRAEKLLADGQPDEALAAIEGRFPQEPRSADLIGRARRAIEERRRREERERARERLLAIDRQIETESRKRKRKELDREAQGVVAAFAADAELMAIAARIHARVDAQPAGGAPGVALPWKQVAIGAGSAAGVGALIFLAIHKTAPEPVKPRPPQPVAKFSVEVRTDPPGAAVQLGGITCVTPNCRVDLAPGPYQVEARLDGYEPKQQSITVDTANSVVDLSLQPLPPPPSNIPPVAPLGTLVVQAGMPDVLVYVDGTARGRTEGSGSLLVQVDGKPHDIRVERNGYVVPAAKRVSVESGARVPVVFNLIPQNAHLELSGAPGNVEVRLDDKPFGRTDGSGVYAFPTPVKPGVHKLEVTQGAFTDQRPGEHSVNRDFGLGQTVRLSWKAPPVAETPPVPVPVPNTPTGTKSVPPPPTKAPTAEELEDREWEKVRASNDPARVREFRSKSHPRYAKEAEALLDRLLWPAVRTDSIESLRGYLQELPSGPHAAEARQRIGNLAWAAVDKNSIDQLRKFVEENPANPNTPEARNLLGMLQGREMERKRQVKDVLTTLNAALEKKKEAGVKAIWPSSTNKKVLESLRLPGQKMSLEPVGDVKLQGDTATVRFILHAPLQRTKEQPGTVVFRYAGGVWTIEDLKYDQ